MARKAFVHFDSFSINETTPGFDQLYVSYGAAEIGTGDAVVAFEPGIREEYSTSTPIGENDTPDTLRTAITEQVRTAFGDALMTVIFISDSKGVL